MPQERSMKTTRTMGDINVSGDEMKVVSEVPQMGLGQPQPLILH